jgi:hypothetical protein
MSQRTIAAHCALPAVQLTARVKRCGTVRGRRGERPARRPDERERQQATPAFDRAVAGRHRWRLHRPLRLLARTSTVEPFAMRAVASVPWGADDASAPLATAARASAVSGRAAAARKVLNLLRVMLAPWLGRNSVALGALRQWPGPRSRYWAGGRAVVVGSENSFHSCVGSAATHRVHRPGYKRSLDPANRRALARPRASRSTREFGESGATNPRAAIDRSARVVARPTSHGRPPDAFQAAAGRSATSLPGSAQTAIMGLCGALAT